MGKVKEHPPVKYFAGITYNPDTKGLQDTLRFLEKTFSAIEIKSEPYDFSDFTQYYESEMGTGLKKLFVVFNELQLPEKLPELKINTNQIESKFILDNKRQINVDPGYVSEAKVVLATTKNYDHRIYLGEGIFGDIHLKFTNKAFQSQPWTYPDYKQDKVIQFFEELRQNYFNQLGETYSNF
jgi:Domain of unknown function (DUF4416)